MARVPPPAVPAFLLLLAACASPAPEFFGAARTEVTVEGRSFTIFREKNRVQVIRHGHAGPAERRAIPDLMLVAVHRATGCMPVASSFQGDSGERRGRISC